LYTRSESPSQWSKQDNGETLRILGLSNPTGDTRPMQTSKLVQPELE
jgi:hypothetical protein